MFQSNRQKIINLSIKTLSSLFFSICVLPGAAFAQGGTFTLGSVEVNPKQIPVYRFDPVDQGFRHADPVSLGPG